MKIFIISDYFPPMIGGVSNSILRISKNLASLGAKISIACFDNEKPIESTDFCVATEQNNCLIYRMGPYFIRNKTCSSIITNKEKIMLRLRVIEQILNKCKENKPDVILSFYAKNACIIGNVVSSTINIPHIICVRGNEITDFLLGETDTFRLGDVLKEADGIICVNQHSKNLLKCINNNLYQKSIVINNSIEPEIDIPKREISRKFICKNTTWDTNDLIISFIGMFRERKGCNLILNYLISTMHQENIKFLVIGPNLFEKEQTIYNEMIRLLELKRKIYFSGCISHEKIYQWLSGGDIIAFPSLDDGIPNGLLEGMICGLCPIVTRINSDFLNNGKNCRVIQNNVESLEEAINYFLDNPQKIQEIGENARRIVFQITPVDEALAYLKYIEHILKKYE